MAATSPMPTAARAGPVGYQPGRPHPIGDRAEQRLKQRGAEAREQQQRAGGGVRVAALAHEEHQQWRHRALHEVDRQVPEREHADPAPVDATRDRGDRHQAETPRTASSTTAERARSGVQRWPVRRWRYVQLTWL